MRPLDPRSSSRAGHGLASTTDAFASGKRCVRGVLFDLDGVLIESRLATIRYIKDIFTAAGRSAPATTAITTRLNMTLSQLISSLSDGEAEGRRLMEIAGRTPYGWSMLTYPPGIREELEALAANYRLALVTSRIREDADHMLRVAGVADLFRAVVGAGDYSHPKPDPEPLLAAVSQLDLCAAACVYVGDSETDVEAARAAGARSILVGDARSAADATVVSFPLVRAAVRRLDPCTGP